MLVRRPGLATAAIVSLALGIGATTSIFSVVNAVALRSLPYADPDRLVWFTELLHGSSTDEFTLTPHFLEWRRQSKSFASLAGYQYQTRNLTTGDRALELHGAKVSATLLPMIGIALAIGRDFTAQEDTKGNDRAAILSDALWREQFASDPNIVGRSITLDGVAHTVTGVLPRSFVFPGVDAVDLLTPLGKDPNETLNQQSFSIVPNVVGRLNPGVTIEQATAELDVINSHIFPKLPWAMRITLDMHPLKDHLYGNAKTTGWILLAAAGFLLWIACANVSSLLLARWTERDRELAIRAALGGTRARLIMQLLTESALLGALACGAGIALAFAFRKPILAFTPYKLAGIGDLPFDGRVLGFAVLAGALTVIVFGVLPAIRAVGARMGSSIKAGEAAVVGGRGSSRVLSLLAAAEIATLLMLSTGAGLTLKSFWKMRYQNLGFSADRLTAVSLRLYWPAYKDEARQFAFLHELQRRAQAIPGVESAAITDAAEIPPGAWHATNVFQIEGRAVLPPGSGQRPIARYPRASPGLFAILQIPLLRGRLFTDGDRSEVCVINQALVDKYFRGENPVGRHLRFGGPDAPWSEIIGVVGDVKLSGLNAAPEPAIYTGYDRANAFNDVGLILKSPFDASLLAGEIRKTVASIDAAQPISKIESLNTRLTESVARPRFIAVLLGAFAALAGILGIIGVYSVVSCRVRWQMRELAVRQALGAMPGDVLRHVLGQGMAMIGLGIVAGIAGSLALSRVLATVLYQVRANDPLTLSAVAMALAAVGLAACWIPARRASRVDPLVLLRYE